METLYGKDKIFLMNDVISITDIYIDITEIIDIGNLFYYGKRLDKESNAFVYFNLRSDV